MPKTLPVVDVSDAICCPPMASAAMSDSDALELALRLKALADPVRVRLMSLLFAAGAYPGVDDGGDDGADEKGEGGCTCDLAPALGLTEATVSHHLGVLKRAGLVTGERRGANVYYRANGKSLTALCQVIDPRCCT